MEKRLKTMGNTATKLSEAEYIALVMEINNVSL